MTYEELKPSVRLRFRRNPTCAICYNIIDPYDNMEYIRYKNAKKYVQYSFFHTRCLCASNERRKYAEAKQNLGSVYGNFFADEFIIQDTSQKGES